MHSLQEGEGPMRHRHKSQWQRSGYKSGFSFSFWGRKGKERKRRRSMAEAEEIKSRKAPSVWGSWGSLSREELAKFKMVAIGSQEPNGCPGPANEASDNKLILPDEDVVRIGEVFRHLPKDQVERLLVETISLDTVPSLLELAMKHNCSELKLGCLKFLVDDGNWVSVSFKFRHEFSVVLHNHPSLVDYIKEMAQNLSGNLV